MKRLLLKFYEFMKRIGIAERYQNNSLEAIIAYSKSRGPLISFYQIKEISKISSYLDTKIKTIEEDSDKHWITTWNDQVV
ncbi:MAG TPA: hypothetical protein VK250_08100 [Nitrososphaeraceae archaeon]|nr:hypothetical protein [Nitrososphaeraceae archaeon]